MFTVEVLEKLEGDLGDLRWAMGLLESHGFLKFFTMFAYLFHLLLYHTELKASLVLHHIVNSEFLHRTLDCLAHFVDLLSELHLYDLVLTAYFVLSCNSFTDIFD